MSIKVKYEAKDGKQFDDRDEAKAWDDTNFSIWLEGNPTLLAKDFVESLDNGRRDEHYGNDRSLASDLLRGYWDNNVE